MAATLHFEEYPYHRNLFALDVREIEGEKFEGWRENANYSARVNIFLQLDSYNVTTAEMKVASNIQLYEETYAFLIIAPTWHVENVSFEEFNEQWAAFEISLEMQVYEIVQSLNNARRKSRLPTLYTGEWYINYGLNEKHIEVKRP